MQNMGLFDFFNAGKIKSENESLKQQIAALQNENNNLINQLNACKSNYTSLQQSYDNVSKSISGERQNEIRKEIFSLNSAKSSAEKDLHNTKEKINIEKQNAEKELQDFKNKIFNEKQDVEKDLQAVQIKLQSANTALKAIQKVIKADSNNNPDVPNMAVNAASLMTHISDLHLNCLDVPALRKLLNANKTNIKKVIQKYETRYTTKSNQAIYQLMVLALEAELQNVLLNLKFGTVDKAKNKIEELTKRYYEIAANGNQSIAPTVKKFISELETFYFEAVDIEYEYYTQKEKIKEEQKALREQMRQEAEERRILEQQQKQVEKEEQKYKNEIQNVKVAISTSDSAEVEKLKLRLAELQKMLMKVEDKKDEIVNLQNGQAGHVYIISNIGSFGENVFKVGMTRRLDPQERIDELGNASVPFPFDVHSLIFSENAVELENNLHKTLDNKRVNKVNKRKEFFSVDINEIEHIVHQIDPSAEFKMTALAEQYNQSLSLNNQR